MAARQDTALGFAIIRHGVSSSMDWDRNDGSGEEGVCGAEGGYLAFGTGLVWPWDSGLLACLA